MLLNTFASNLFQLPIVGPLIVFLLFGCLNSLHAARRKVTQNITGGWKHVALGGNARPGCVEVFFHAANYTKNSVPLAERMTLILDMRLTTYDGRYRHATDARRKS